MSAAEPKQETKMNPWDEYERLKRELPDDLSTDERDRELRRIADELGI